MTTRRTFLAGCSAAVAAMAGGRVGRLVFADAREASQPDTSDHILVSIFLRGGCDGLSLVAPYDDPIYVAKRGSLAVKGALPIQPNNTSFQSSVGLHPSAAPLKELYEQGQLAIVHACGLNNSTRSHFEAMDYIERGTPGDKNLASGWLARHLQCIHPDGTLPALSADSATPAALLGDPSATTMNDPRSYGISGPWHYTNNTDIRYQDAMLKTAASFYTGSDLLHSTARRTFDIIRSLRDVPEYRTDAGYPGGSFSDSLRTVAQMIKLDLGLRAATVDLGGWDHHESQGVNDTWGPFTQLVGELAKGLGAFYNDLAAYQRRLTVVVVSEFGRRLGKNLSEGTDHGHGNAMLVLGGAVNGGKVYGRWPGLQAENLDQHEDLQITTDFRTVLGEIVVRQLGNPRLGVVFPQITPQIYSAQTQLGIVSGPNPTIDYGTI